MYLDFYSRTGYPHYLYSFLIEVRMVCKLSLLATSSSPSILMVQSHTHQERFDVPDEVEAHSHKFPASRVPSSRVEDSFNRLSMCATDHEISMILSTKQALLQSQGDPAFENICPR